MNKVLLMMKLKSLDSMTGAVSVGGSGASFFAEADAVEDFDVELLPSASPLVGVVVDFTAKPLRFLDLLSLYLMLEPIFTKFDLLYAAKCVSF